MTRALAESLDDSLIERVLAKLGLQATPSPDLEGLARLYDAWCRRVPFDYVQKPFEIEEMERKEKEERAPCAG